MTTGPEGAPRPPQVRRPAAAPRVPSPLIGQFAATLAVAPVNRKSAKIQAFWAHAAAQGTPLTEPAETAGQQIVTFLWRSPADEPPVAVYLFVNRLTDELDLGRSLMAALPGTDIWHLSYQLDDNWRASYAFCPISTAEAHRAVLAADQSGVRQWLDSGIPDPLNPDRVRGAGERELSMVSLTGAPPQPWRVARPGITAGAVRSQQLPATAGLAGRTVWVYDPVEPLSGGPGPTLVSEDVPTILLLDGEVWLHSIGIAATMDNLIASGRIPPIRLVLPHSLDTTTRWRELTARPEVIDALADHLLPAVGVHSAPQRTAIAGNSLGGLTAIAAVMRRPDRFGHAISMSGSTWWHVDDSQAPLLEQWAAARADDAAIDGGPPAGSIELQLGSQEWVLDRPTRTLTAALQAAGWRAELVEYNGGHDFAWWQGSFADAVIRWADRLGHD